MASKGNQPNREELLLLAESAAKQGNKDGARVMFRQILSQDKRNERALLGLAKLAKTPKERKQWLQRLLAVNPDHQAAKSTLEKLKYKEASSTNRILILFGAILVAMVIIAVVVLVALPALNR